MSIESDLDSVEISEVDDFDNYEITEATYRNTEECINWILERCKDISRELEKECYNIIESVESEENIKELCQSNEYRFFANGEMFHE